MEFSEIKEYIDKIKDSNKFKKLDEFTRMTRIKENEDIYINIMNYIKIYHPIRNTRAFFQPNYEYVMNFLQHYIENEPTSISFGKDGFADLVNTLYLVQPNIFSGNQGNFLDHYMMMTDGSVYISKLPLNYRGNSGVTNKDCLYCPLIASYIAKTVDVECADITLAKAHNGYRILSKNFLKENEEIVTYTEDKDYISEYLSKIDEELKYRKFDEKEIEKTKLEFIKQEFVAKLIGLKDQTANNSPLIVKTDENGNRHVKMAPMFDLDYSFQIAKDMDMITRKCDNGKTDIGSLIEQYIDYPGFKEFAKKSIENLDIVKIFEQIYQNTGIEKFKTYNSDEQMSEFSKFVTGNIQLAKRTLDKFKENERDGK